MAVDYQQRLTPVIRHIETQFMQPLNLCELAELANLSAYHFHRVFKAVTAETPQEMVRRLRLESAASTLFHSNQSITEIALTHGFSSSQSLAKAFRQHFALTPTAIKDCTQYDELQALLQNSKIGHQLSKAGHARSLSDSYTGPVLTNRSQNTMNIEQFKPSALAYIRITGPYGQGFEEATHKLYQWAGANGLTQPTCMFIYHDNPEITPADKCRTDICLVVPEGTKPSSGVEVTTFTGGSYAVVREHITDISQYATVWEALMGQVVSSHLEMDERPCFELYHHFDLETKHADVSFCVAVKA